MVDLGEHIEIILDSYARCFGEPLERLARFETSEISLGIERHRED